MTADLRERYLLAVNAQDTVLEAALTVVARWEEASLCHLVPYSAR
jgi:hypothetical protein